MPERHPSVTIRETPSFREDADRIFTPDELGNLCWYLANNPESGVKIPGTGGIRKIRVGAGGKGKQGGARVIYYYHSANIPLLLLAVYEKNEKIDLSSDEKKELKYLVNEYVRGSRL